MKANQDAFLTVMHIRRDCPLILTKFKKESKVLFLNFILECPWKQSSVVLLRTIL